MIVLFITADRILVVSRLHNDRCWLSLFRLSTKQGINTTKTEPKHSGVAARGPGGGGELHQYFGVSEPQGRV